MILNIMKIIYVGLFICFLNCEVYSYDNDGASLKSIPPINQIPLEATFILNLKIHIDLPLTLKLMRYYTRSFNEEFSKIINKFISSTTRYIKQLNAPHDVKVNVIAVKFLKDTPEIKIDRNRTIYLNNYCRWQEAEKYFFNGFQYYSVLLTGVELDYDVADEDVPYPTRYTERTSYPSEDYLNSFCDFKRSCAIVEYLLVNDTDVNAFFLARYLATSLGAKTANCDQKSVLGNQFDLKSLKHEWHWAHCTKEAVKNYLRNHKCYQPVLNAEYDGFSSYRQRLQYLNNSA